MLRRMRQQFYLYQGTEYVHVWLRAKIDWLVFNGTSAHAEGKCVPTTGGGRKPAQSAKDDQREAINA